jgi:release factor glutamine methyltransferase
MTIKTWQLIDLLNTTSDYFKNHGIENARLNAEWLLAHALKINRVQLYLQFERLLTKAEIEQYRMLVRRRIQHEPLQYILSETEFMGLPFHITPAVFIPRTETELLVEQALTWLNHLKIESPLVWDIGTGSGCIAVSIAYHCTACRVIASDISAAALDLALQNAHKNGVDEKIQFFQHNILTDDLPDTQPISLILSNPPYIAASEWETLPEEVRLFEPATALTDQQDGLTFYKRFFKMGRSYNCNYYMLELTGTQPDKIFKLAQNYHYKNIKMVSDYNDIPRIMEITVNE